ncbi:adenylate/guanylate cyclase domain-containing protein [Thioflexithrix psekupsensis]|uniref:Guanylate cyclase domain-containing protein n=1 Tax=Thioflexithrix psekupsensis TaxID=1570016 RepID=A0A251XBC1_9GAMM|nr:adenylate/guanylate cyclase domain-containing protein [Thioflexithrix psekupsensis]OUD15390.1 hypothetical protein TPSD3_02355 [Thioflexithrix psekupsensis]
MKYSLIESRLFGSFRTRFWLEFFGNSVHFALANFLFEMVLRGSTYLRSPDPYVLLIGSLLQSYVLVRWQNTSRPRRFLGNLIGPLVYTVIEVSLEGMSFFDSTNHLAYWLFSIIIGLLQEIRLCLPRRFSPFFIVTESIFRTSILLAMYVLFETHSTYFHAQHLSLAGTFFSDESHRFIAFSLVSLGFVIGLANWTAERYLNLLKTTSNQLHKYSEWLLGKHLLEQSFINPSALSLVQSTRFILFMDIRGFTSWSEKQHPKNVADLLNKYYEFSELVLSQYGAIKFKLSADEVMAVFPSAELAVQAAIVLSKEIEPLLKRESIGAGIGVDGGLLVEGLFGSTGVRFYDVIGDTVNTAKRIEGAAQAGEILISDRIYNTVQDTVQIHSKKEIIVKGKKDPLLVYSIVKL